MRRLFLVSVLLFTALACSDEDKGSDGGGSANANTTLLGLLGSVPDSEANRDQPIFYGNLGALRAGDEPGSFEEDARLLDERSSNSIGLPRTISRGIAEPEFREFVGFDTREIDAFVDFGSEADQASVMMGDFDSGDVEKGLKSSPGGDALAEETVDGVTFLSLGTEGEIDFEAVSAVRRLGEPVRIAIGDGTLYWSRTRALTDACVAATAGSETSLADDAAFASAAAVLDGASVITGLLLPPWSGESWTLAALGETFQGKTSTLTIALHYADASDAVEAVAAFRAHVESGVTLSRGIPWSELLTIIDVRAEGKLMIATLTSFDPGIASDIYFRAENLLQF